MPECNIHINKNHLLTLYFHEGGRREGKRIKAHVSQCEGCQDYLSTLGYTDRTLQQWQDEKPLENTWALISGKLPAKCSKPVIARPTLSIVPLLKILFTILAVLAAIFLVHDKIALLPLWQTLKEFWLARLLGTFGVTAFLFFLVGIGITLSLAPVLIMESQTRKYRYFFN